MLGMIIVLALIVTALKFSIRRRRPEGEWGAIYRSTDPHSFPSGHAARAALLAILSLAWGPSWLGAMLLIWAPFVLLARVAMGLHYLSDVIVGATLGVITGLLGIFVLG
jgi:undecaprenyl-diphosphatase